MDLTPYVNAIRDDLNTAASAGDEQTKRAAATLSAALEPATRLAMMNALSDLAAEVTAALPDQVVEVRLDGRDVRVVITDVANGDEAPSATSSASSADSTTSSVPPGEAGGDISRLTLRLMEQLKGQAEQQAAAQGVSLNTFVSQAVQGALHGAGQHGWPPRGRARTSGGGSRLHGWVRG